SQPGLAFQPGSDWELQPGFVGKLEPGSTGGFQPGSDGSSANPPDSAAACCDATAASATPGDTAVNSANAAVAAAPAITSRVMRICGHRSLAELGSCRWASMFGSILYLYALPLAADLVRAIHPLGRRGRLGGDAPDPVSPGGRRGPGNFGQRLPAVVLR